MRVPQAVAEPLTSLECLVSPEGVNELTPPPAVRRFR
jgi:hypothetical protein